MHPAAVSGDVVLRVLSIADTRERILCRRWCQSAPRALISDIAPEPCGLCLAGAGRQHADRCIVGKDRLCRQNVPSDGIGQGFQQGCCLADAVGQGRAIKIEPLAVEDLALQVKRQMVGILADQNVGQEARPGAATLNWPRRQRRLDEAFATGAGQPEPRDPVHDEAARYVFQFLGVVLADPGQAPAAVGAGIGGGGQLDLPAGCDRGSDGASVCPSLRCPAASSVRSSWQLRSRRSAGPTAAARRSLMTPRTGAPGARQAGAAASRSGSLAPSPRPKAAP